MITRSLRSDERRDLNIAYARSVAKLDGCVRDPGGMAWGHPRGADQTIMLATGFGGQRD